MRVIPPLSGGSPCIADAQLTSSTATEPGAGETAWSGGTAYAVGDVAVRTSIHRKYSRLVAGTTATAPESDTTNWLDIGPTNKWAMFDLLRNSATVLASPLTVVITPGVRVNALALMGVVADSVTITITVSAVTVYTYTASMSSRNTTTWTDYFYGTFSNQPSLARFDLPPYTNGVITVTLTRASGSVSCGACMVGVSQYLGAAQYNAVREALNFSTVTRDAFGNATLVARRSVPKTAQQLQVDKTNVNRLLDLIVSLNAVPAVWSGLDDQSTDGYFEALLILGVYKQFSINVDHPSTARATLELEEI